jgi:hypothetical protein
MIDLDDNLESEKSISDLKTSSSVPRTICFPTCKVDNKNVFLKFSENNGIQKYEE